MCSGSQRRLTLERPICSDVLHGLPGGYSGLMSLLQPHLIKAPSSLLVNLFLSLVPWILSWEIHLNPGTSSIHLVICGSSPTHLEAQVVRGGTTILYICVSHNTQKNTCFIREYCVTLKNIGCSEVGSTCQCRRRRFHPLVEKIPWRRKWRSH